MIGYIVFHVFCLFYTIGAHSYEERMCDGKTQSVFEILWTIIFAPLVAASHIGWVMAKLDQK